MQNQPSLATFVISLKGVLLLLALGNMDMARYSKNLMSEMNDGTFRNFTNPARLLMIRQQFVPSKFKRLVVTGRQRPTTDDAPWIKKLRVDKAVASD